MSQSLAYARRLPCFARPTRSAATTFRGARPRLDSVDLLRGLVLLLMALDHTRDFFGAGGMNPRDVADPALFVTRWITHFCAPVFVLLAGVSAFLYGARGRTSGELSWFLLTRGVWLIVVEFTLVRIGWTFALTADVLVLQVIFALGASMVALAALVHLPRGAIATIAIVLIAGHNLFDGIRAEQFGAFGWVWSVLHQPAMLEPAGGPRLLALYSLVPWVGVMAAGYALGPLVKAERSVRVTWLLVLGVALSVGFVLLRASNAYGDPQPWSPQQTPLATILAFVNCEKYPPSLLYLMMTLGPALVLLAGFESARGRLAGIITTFGRVPLAYYLAHIYLIHALAVVYFWSTGADVFWLFGNLPGKPATSGLGLAGVYAVWLVVLVVLYPLCRWFAAIKQRHRAWWLSYL
jgi:uncharacterized membrane protein